MSFMKRGNNPFPFAYGYDGNGMAESMVNMIQEEFPGLGTYKKTKKTYIREVREYFSRLRQENIESTLSAVKIVNKSKVPLSVFQARRQFHFEAMPKISRADYNRLKRRDGKTKFGESYYRGQEISRQVMCDFHDDVQPIIRLTQQNYKRLMDDPTVEFDNLGTTFKNYLKMIPQPVLWNVMNNPDQDFDLDHTEILTWEFILLHDPDLNPVFEKEGTMNIRNRLGYDVLATPGAYKNYREFKDAIDDVRDDLTILSNGHFLCKQGHSSMKDFTQRVAQKSEDRRQLFCDLFQSLIEGGMSGFKVQLKETMANFESHDERRARAKAQIEARKSKALASTPSP